MRLFFTLLLSVAIGGFSLPQLWAQDLAPRAYVITPLRSNAITFTYSFYTGSVLLAGAVPITNASATVHVSTFSIYHSLNFFGRSANIVASLPYGVGNFQGDVGGNQTAVYRSGLLDAVFRFAVNLKGGPAMDLPEIRNWHQKTLIGLSLKVVSPTGQYDPTKLVNFGTNRWAFKPEVGVSRRWGHWLLDTYGGAWFYTTNPDYYSRNQVYPGTRSQEENPIGSFEGHLSYDVRPRLWASLDGNFWFGGQTSINGVENSSTLQLSSRIGGTISVPVSKHQSLKISYSHGDYIRYGGDFSNVNVAWQYSWVGWPK
ncbi:MAG: transporter [Terriglobales bacterium]